MNEVTGLDEVLANLNREIGGIEERGMDGLFAAGLIIQAGAQKRAPVDTGNLRASAYTRRDQRSVEIGFTAAYAVFVHENLEQKLKGQPRRGGSGKGQYWEVGGPKFLERSITDNEALILDTIRDYASVE